MADDRDEGGSFVDDEFVTEPEQEPPVALREEARDIREELRKRQIGHYDNPCWCVGAQTGGDMQSVVEPHETGTSGCKYNPDGSDRVVEDLVEMAVGPVPVAMCRTHDRPLSECLQGKESAYSSPFHVTTSDGVQVHTPDTTRHGNCRCRQVTGYEQKRLVTLPHKPGSDPRCTYWRNDYLAPRIPQNSYHYWELAQQEAVDRTFENEFTMTYPRATKPDVADDIWRAGLW